MSSGIALLGAYSFGLAIPFLLTAAFTGAMLVRLRALGRAGRWLQTAAGIGMVAMGAAMIAGLPNKMALWLLDTFPVFSAIG